MLITSLVQNQKIIEKYKTGAEQRGTSRKKIELGSGVMTEAACKSTCDPVEEYICLQGRCIDILEFEFDIKMTILCCQWLFLGCLSFRPIDKLDRTAMCRY